MKENKYDNINNNIHVAFDELEEIMDMIMTKYNKTAQNVKQEQDNQAEDTETETNDKNKKSDENGFNANDCINNFKDFEKNYRKETDPEDSTPLSDTIKDLLNLFQYALTAVNFEKADDTSNDENEEFDVDDEQEIESEEEECESEEACNCECDCETDWSLGSSFNNDAYKDSSTRFKEAYEKYMKDFTNNKIAEIKNRINNDNDFIEDSESLNKFDYTVDVTEKHNRIRRTYTYDAKSLADAENFIIEVYSQWTFYCALASNNSKECCITTIVTYPTTCLYIGNKEDRETVTFDMWWNDNTDAQYGSREHIVVLPNDNMHFVGYRFFSSDENCSCPYSKDNMFYFDEINKSMLHIDEEFIISNCDTETCKAEQCLNNETDINNVSCCDGNVELAEADSNILADNLFKSLNRENESVIKLLITPIIAGIDEILENRMFATVCTKDDSTIDAIVFTLEDVQKIKKVGEFWKQIPYSTLQQIIQNRYHFDKVFIFDDEVSNGKTSKPCHSVRCMYTSKN